MNDFIKSWLEDQVNKVDDNQCFFWGRTKKEFINSEIEFISFKNESVPYFSGGEIIFYDRTKLYFRIITRKWVNCYIPWVSIDYIILSKDELRDLKIGIIL